MDWVPASDAPVPYFTLCAKDEGTATAGMKMALKLSSGAAVMKTELGLFHGPTDTHKALMKDSARTRTAQQCPQNCACAMLDAPLCERVYAKY